VTDRAPRIVIAAGGTGGHMFPAQALSEMLLARGWRVTLSTDARGARYTQAFPDAVEIEEVASATFARGGPLAKLAVPFRILGGILSSVAAFRRTRPDVVIGFGGYPSIPAVAAARLLGLPRMIHEQNGVLGRVNQLMARRVQAVACGTWPTALPRGVTGIHTGNPVRAGVADRAGAPYVPPGDGPMQVVVIGGSQGARILSDTVPAAIAALPDALRSRVRMSHQARAEDLDRVTGFYAGNGIEADVQTFFHDVPDRFAAAQLVVARAGASTVADITVIGRPAILIPLAIAIRDEQTANATGLSQAGAALLIPESQLDPAMLSSHIAAILGNPQTAVRMADAARGMGRPDAADRLAALVERLAQGQGLGHEA